MCSLHFAAYDYAKNSYRGAHIVVVKINPADVVSIPNDYNNQKGRCCRYEVIGERKDYTPLPKQEVYSDADVGCPEVGGNVRATSETNREDIFLRVRIIVADVSPTLYESDILSNTVLVDNAQIYNLGSDSELVRKLVDEFSGIDFSALSDESKVWDIVNLIVDQTKEATVATDALFDESATTEDVDYLDEDDDEDPTDEEIEYVIDAVEKKIVARIVHDSLTFKQAFLEEAIDIDFASEYVIDKIKEAGLHAWF